MDKEFVPFEQAVELKELGFSEDCLAYYDIVDEYSTLFFIEYKKHDNVFSYQVLAPLYQQAFRWFKNKYSIVLYKEYGKIPHFTIIQNLMFENPGINYKDAELACLKELIEIIKNK